MTLSMDTSTLTTCNNIFKFRNIFSRPFEALSKKNDLLIVISTSNSSNVCEIYIRKNNNSFGVKKSSKNKNFL